MNIRPCPHCGGAAELIGVYDPKKKMKLMKVICDNCGATGAEVYCICLDANGTDATACRDAINAWNVRTNADEAQNRPQNRGYSGRWQKVQKSEQKRSHKTP